MPGTPDNPVAGGQPQVATFDDVSLPAGGETAQPYTQSDNLLFTGVGVYHPTSPVDQYDYAQPTSGQNLAFSGLGYGQGWPSITSANAGHDFNLFSGDFTATFHTPGGEEITATAYDNGKVVGVYEFEVQPYQMTHVDFTHIDGQRFTSIDHVTFTSTNFFGFDNLVFMA